MTLTVGSLFSGIGGLDLGLERAGMRVIWQSEIDPYACRVLAKHWPHVPNLGDITTIDWSTVERPDVVCGGYPCPAFSQAARGRNVAPDLWPHMRTAIGALRPGWVVLENVAAHLGRGFASVLADFYALGFDAEWSTVTACSVGAPHMRRRLFAVAHPHGDGESVFAVDGEMARLSTTPADRRNGWLPTPDDVRTDDGIPHRLDRLRALGNAVVPQVAEHIGRMIVSASASRTSAVDARPTLDGTRRTAVHRCADGDVRPHTCRTAVSLDDPSGDESDVVADHRDRPDRPATRATNALHARSVDLGDGDGLIERGGTDAEDDIADLQITDSLVAHAVSQPQTSGGVNHK